MFNNVQSSNDACSKYLSTNPQCKLLKPDELLKAMLRDGAISEEEYNKIKNGDTFKFTFSETNLDDVNGLWGAKFSTAKTSQNNYVEKVRQFHPKFPDLELNDAGKIDTAQFDYSRIRDKFNENDYLVEEKPGKAGSTITLVIDKKTNKTAASYFQLKIAGCMSYEKFDENGKQKYSVSVNSKGNVTDFLDIGEDGTKTSYLYSERNPDKVLRVIKYLPDGSLEWTNYDEEGRITRRDFLESGGNMPSITEEYANGKLNRIVDNKSGTVENFLLKDLVKDTGLPNKMGYFTKASANLNEDILKRINRDNVLGTLASYKKETGKDMFTAIKKNTAIAQKTKDKLLAHLEKTYIQGESNKEGGKFLGELLFDDISGLGSGRLKEHLQLINRSNLKYVLQTYANKSLEKYVDIRDFFNKELPVNLKYRTSKNISEVIAPMEGLLTAINGEFGLSKTQRSAMISEIINTSLEGLPDNVKESIQKDINEHPDDLHKVSIDILRALNRTECDNRNPNDEVETVSVDGSFNEPVKQGRTGDCWLVAALDSLLAKPAGKAAIKSLIDFDPTTGNAIVNLKGPHKKYVITAEEIKAANRLSSSGNARIIELAMDRLIKEEAYEKKDPTFGIDSEFDYIHDVDLNGNFSRYLYFSLLGYDVYDFDSYKIDASTEDFSNPQKAYAFSLSGDDQPGGIFAKDSNNNEVSIERRHAYAIVGSDDKNIFIVNPRNSEVTLTIAREDFVKLRTSIEASNIPQA